MTKIDLIKLALANAKDAGEIERLNKELLDAIRAEEREKLEKELAAKALKDAEEKAIKEREEALKKAEKPVASGVKVGLPGVYKGRKLKMEMDALGKMRSEWKDEHRSEVVAKAWLDALDRAQNRKGPVEKATVMGEDNTADYLVAPEYSNEYISYANEYSRALQICRNVRMSSDVQYIPTELARVSIALTAEGTDATVTSATFAQTTLTAKRFDAFTTVSNEVLTDMNVPVLPILLSQLTEAVGNKIDSCVFDGTGTPMSSVFSAAAGYSVVLGIGSSTFASVTQYSSFLEVVGKLPSARQKNARWVSHRTPLWAYIYAVKDASSRPLFINTMETAGINGPVGRILGFPVTQTEYGPKTTAVSTSPIVFGDFSGVAIGHRLDNVDLFIDPYTVAKSYQTNVYMFTRFAFSLALANNFVRLVTAAS